jgi:hypothetical protein
MQAGEPTVDGRWAQSDSDLVIDNAVDILHYYGLERFVTGDVDGDIQVADVVLQSPVLPKRRTRYYSKRAGARSMSSFFE